MNNQFLEQIVVGAKVDTRGFKKADSALAKLNRNVKSLAASFGVAYGTRALVQYGKTAVKAFAEDDKAATILSKTLKNLGLQFADPRVREFIAQLEAQYGVLDDYLRPAYQKLVTTTGDWERSQSLLKTALDLSAQSGYDVVTVAEDLGKAYVGNTKGLQKYALGIKKADLASMSFEEILKRVAKVSAGAAQEAADTYSGKLDKLTVAASNASEKIGGALLDAVIKFGGGDVDKATSKVDSFAGAIEKLIRLATGTGGMSFKDILNSVDYKFGIIPVNRPQFAPTRGGAAGAMAAQAAEKKAKDEAARKAREEAAARAKLLKAQQDQLKLAKAKAIFDLQKIQIEAALKGKISDEERLRLKLMQAIEDENITQIEKYTKLLDEAQKKTVELVDTLAKLKFPELQVPTALQPNGKEFSSLTTLVAQSNIQPNLKEWSSSFSPSAMLPAAPVTSTPAPVVNVTVQGSVIAENDLAQVVNNAIANSNWAGSAVGYGRQAVTTAV